MKAKICEAGNLWLTRKGKFKRQTCRFSGLGGENRTISIYCADDCPFFRIEGFVIYLCKGDITCESITDERR